MSEGRRLTNGGEWTQVPEEVGCDLASVVNQAYVTNKTGLSAMAPRPVGAAIVFYNGQLIKMYAKRNRRSASATETV